MLRFRRAIAVTLLVIVAPLAALAQNDRLTVATIGEPPGLDTMLPYGILAQHIGKHIYENLFTFDADWRPVPQLLASYDLSEDGTVYTFRLRAGVPFHDGSLLNANDVVASLTRWIEVESTARSTVAPVFVSLEAVDDLTVRLELSAPVSPLTSMLAADGAPIYRAEIVEKYGEDAIQEFIGTGPYRFSEWLPDRYLELERFDDYANRTEEASGFAGSRDAAFQYIRFTPVPDVAVRAAGVQAGQYDVALDINPDMYTQFANDNTVQPVVIAPFGWPFFALNKAEGVFADKCLRQALLASLNMSDMMAAGFGDPDLYDTDGSIYPPEIATWYTQAGTENYNQNDPARARQLLEECGYDGTPVRVLTSRQYDFLYRISLVAGQQLEAAGFTVELMVVEWATLAERRQQPSAYEFFVSFNSMSPAPPLYQLWLFEYWPGWWANADKDALLAELNEAVSVDDQVAVWGRIQEMIYDEVPAVKIGNFYGLALASPNIEGLQERYTMPFWNVRSK